MTHVLLCTLVIYILRFARTPISQTILILLPHLTLTFDAITLAPARRLLQSLLPPRLVHRAGCWRTFVSTVSPSSLVFALAPIGWPATQCRRLWTYYRHSISLHRQGRFTSQSHLVQHYIAIYHVINGRTRVLDSAQGRLSNLTLPTVSTWRVRYLFRNGHHWTYRVHRPSPQRRLRLCRL